jgi:hypothetical protein
MPKVVEKRRLSITGVDQHGNSWSLSLENPEVTNKFILSLKLNDFEWIIERFPSERSAQQTKMLLNMLSKSALEEEVISPAKVRLKNA